MTSSNVIVAGFIPLLDCAPLVVAAERGFATEEGLDITLVRETSWANIRDRIIVGHFDVAHMLGPMAVASTLGIGHLRVPLIAPFSFGLGGNAITVSNPLWKQMTAHGAQLGGSPSLQGAALKKVVKARELARRTPLTIAMVYPFSSHNYLLRYWLASSGIDPEQDVRLVVLPPPLLVDAMREGQIDGFCVGAPWGSVAVSAGVGCIVTLTAEIWRNSPEKVLACRSDWAQRNPSQLRRLIRSLDRSARWCSDPGNHEELARLLADPRFIGAPADLLMLGLSNTLTLASDSTPRAVPGFYSVFDHCANQPRASHALWFYSQMVRWRQVEFSEELIAATRATYRADLYCDALEQPRSNTVRDRDDATGFFDDILFDPWDLRAYLQQFGVRC